MCRNTVLTLSLLTLSCSGNYPVESEYMNYRDSNSMLIHEDPFELRARGQEAPVASQVTQPIEPRTGPWSGNNQLGISRQFAPDANNRQTILKLDEWGMPKVWTVMLGISDDDLGLIGYTLRVKAVLDIGVGGVTQRVVVDWKQGTVISAPMNALNIISDYELSSGYDPAVDTPIELRVSLSQGDHGGEASPTFTTFLSGSAGGAAKLVDIPAFATHVQGYRFDLASADPLVPTNHLQFYGAAGVGDPISLVDADNLIAYGALGPSIPNGAKYVGLTTPGVTTMTTVFTLGGL
jgi:hypothetical protein